MSKTLISKIITSVQFFQMLISTVLFQEAHEGIASREAFGGRLTLDFVAEKVGHTTFEDVQELDFPNFGIRAVDLGPAGRFMNLRRYTQKCCLSQGLQRKDERGYHFQHPSSHETVNKADEYTHASTQSAYKLKKILMIKFLSLS